MGFTVWSRASLDSWVLGGLLGFRVLLDFGCWLTFLVQGFARFLGVGEF